MGAEFATRPHCRQAIDLRLVSTRVSTDGYVGELSLPVARESSASLGLKLRLSSGVCEAAEADQIVNDAPLSQPVR